MKPFFAKAGFLFAMLFSCASPFAQTRVNLSRIDTIDHAYGQIIFYAAQMDGNNNLFMSYNIHKEGQNNLLVGKLNTGYEVEWFTPFPGTPASYKAGVDVTLKDGYMYVTGGEVDSASASAIYQTIKLRQSDGDTMWTASYQGSYGGYTFAAGCEVDDSGNVYVTGTEQSAALDSKMTMAKYDSTGVLLWSASYDSVGMFDGGVAMLPPNSRTVTTTGFSGTGWGSWDFNTVDFSPGGSVLTWNRIPNGNGNFSKPVALRKDEHQNFYVLGTSTVAGTNTDIKLIKYDSLFNEQWVRTWGDPALPEEATMLQYLNAAQTLVVLGTATNSSGGKEIVTLAYDVSGALLWSRSIGAPNPRHDARAVDGFIANDDNIYITGTMFNGADTDVVVTSYSITGNERWLKRYNRAGANDSPKGIYEDDDGIVVTATSEGVIDTLFLLLQYEQEKTSGYEIDSLFRPRYVKNEIILKLNKNAVRKQAINNLETQFWHANEILKQDAFDSLQSRLPFDVLKDCTFGRIFSRLRTTDTVSISRLGEEIPIPDFWSTLTMTFPPGFGTEQNVCDWIRPLFPLVEYATIDAMAFPLSVPDDQYYGTQISLSPPFASSSVLDINVEEAWNHTTGRRYIKAGVFDTGLMLSHRDFYTTFDDSALVYTDCVIRAGWDYVYDDTIINTNAGGVAVNQHGTEMTGIIGAVRNNTWGIAGIAGGDSSLSYGVSLYPFRFMTESVFDGVSSVAAPVSRFANGIVEASTQVTDNSYGFGVHIINNSYGIDISGTLLVDSGYTVDSNMAIITDAFHYANRNKVVLTAASGNDEKPYLYLPAGLDDQWMLSVGGTGIGGNMLGHTLGDMWVPNYGYGLDIAAPAGDDMIYTTQIDSYATTANYGRFGYTNGTSAATAHVSGASALLLSYLNDSVAAYKNLAPEDVEFLIQRSAFNVDTPGYDLGTGFGRLNAGGALSIVDTALRKLLHFDSGLVPHATEIEEEQVDLPMYLLEKAVNRQGSVFNRGAYKADIYKITCTMVLSLVDTLVASWTRASSSFTYPYDGTDSLVPHERLTIENINETEATVSGYTYHLKDFLTNADIGWLPFDTMVANSQNFAISVLVGDTIYAPWDSLISTIASTKNDAGALAVFPNPAGDFVYLEAATNCQSEVKIALYDINGTEIQPIFKGMLASERKFLVNTEKLPGGVYVAGMQSSCGTRAIKIIKL